MRELQGTWMWTPDWTEADEETARVVYFRHPFYVTDVPDHWMIHISADSRYKLYVNGTLVEAGPAKGDSHVWYEDTVDLAPSLHAGENVAAVAVLRFPPDVLRGNHSVFRIMAGLYMEGLDGPWYCHVDRCTAFYAEEERFAPLWIHEKAARDSEVVGWKESSFAGNWKPAETIPSEAVPAPLNALMPRSVPYMQRIPHAFTEVRRVCPPNQECSFVLDAGEEMCAYLSLAVCGGAGARIELLEAECYSIPGENGLTKGNRLDRNGILTGYRDFYAVSGAGTRERPEVYEPYWWRTFRFLEVRVRTAEEPLEILSLNYDETGYPLKVKTTVRTSDASLAGVWEISLRTLRRCMHETYMDCPFYEQLQYAMDTRSEILYTYALSADDRLARQAMDDFRRAQRPDGLLNCSYPNNNVNVIPGFSIYYILMVHDHMMYFGDRELVSLHLPAIDRVLAFFDARLTKEGLVDKIGGVNGEAPFWSFIDWAREWMPTQGMPAAGLTGPITMESLLYLLGLQTAAELMEYVGQSGEAYRVRAAKLQAAIRGHCMQNGFLTDGIRGGGVSQQAQVFGILTGTLSQTEGREALLASVRDPDVTKCTVAMAFYLFRALEQTELYEYTDQYWDIWRKMVRNGCSTCVEAENYARSECHAWGALALYELPSITLGVRPAAPGYERIRVCPVPGYLSNASGTVCTPHGDVHVAWEKKDGELLLSVECEDSVRRRIIMTE